MSLQKRIVRGEIWAFIPARSGSKSVKDKNIFKLNNKPLIYYTFQTLKKIKGIKRVVFSTDSKKYIKIAKNFGKFEPHLREKYSSIDSATDLEAAKACDIEFILVENKFNKLIQKIYKGKSIHNFLKCHKSGILFITISFSNKCNTL